MTTANMSVGIDTSKAKSDLVSLKEWMKATMATSAIKVAIDPDSIDRSIAGFLKQKTFKIRVDTKALSSEIENDVGLALDRAFRKPGRTLAWNQAALAGGLNAALHSAFGDKGRRIAYDRVGLHGDIQQNIALALAGQYKLHIDSVSVTAQVREAVAAGLAGATLRVGATGGAAGAPAASQTLATSGLISDLKSVMTQILTPAVDELSKAASLVAGTARKVGLSADGTPSKSSASKSQSRTDSATGERFSVRTPLDVAPTLADIQGARASQLGPDRSTFDAARAARRRAQQAGDELNDLGERAALLKRMRAQLAGDELNEVGQRAQLFRQRRNAEAREELNETGQRAQQLMQRRRQLAGDELNEVGQRAVQLRQIRAQLAGQELNETGQRAAQIAQRRAERKRESEEVRAFYEEAKFRASQQFTGKGVNISAARDTSTQFGSSATRQMLGSQRFLLGETGDLDAYRKKLAEIKPHADAAVMSHQALNEAMRDGRGLARGMAGSLGALWTTYGSIVPLVAAAAIGASLRGIYEEGKRVEYQLAFVKGLTNESVTTKQFEAATAGSQFSATQAAEGLRALSQSGFSARESIGALPEVLRLATVGETSVMEAAFAATGVLKAFGLQMSEIGRVSDVMSKAASISNASVGDMMQAFKYASASGAMYGASLEETGAAIAMLSEKNIKGSMAGTAHMNLLREIYTPTKKAGEAFKALGLDMQGMQRAGLSTTEIIDKIREKTARLDSTGVRQFTADVGGERGNRELAPLLTGGTKTLKQFEEELKNAGGFTKSVMMELQNTVEGSSARMKQSLSFALAEAFESGKGPIQRFQDTLAAAFGGEQFKGYVTGLTNGMVGATRFVMDHAEAIKNVGLAYVGLKVAGGVSAVMASLSTSMMSVNAQFAAKLAYMPLSIQGMLTQTGVVSASTIAESNRTKALLDQARAEAVRSTAVGASTGAVVASTAVTSAAAVAQGGLSGVLGTVAGTVAGLARGFTALLGPLGLLLSLGTLVYTMWELMSSRQSAARDIQDSYTNSVLNTNRILDQELSRLKEKRFLLANPGKTGQQATVELAAERQAAYIKSVETARGSKGDTSAQYYATRKFNIVGEDGESKSVKGSEIDELFAKLGDVKKDHALTLSKIARVNTETASFDAAAARKSLSDWAVEQVDTLKARKKEGGKVGAALDAMTAYTKVENLGAITTMRQADAAKKGLQPLADSGGAGFTVPKTGEAHKLEAAESRTMISGLRNEEAAIKQAIRFRAELDNARYSEKLYGPYVAATLAEQRQLTETTTLIDFQRKAVKALEAAKLKPNATSADKEGFTKDIEQFNSQIKLAEAELEQKKKLADFNAEERARELQFNAAKRLRNLGGDDSRQIDQIRQQFDNKIASPATAAGNEAALAVQARYAGEIATLDQVREELARKLTELEEKRVFLSGEELSAADAAIGAARTQLAIDEKLLQNARDQARVKSFMARSVAEAETRNSETAAYGWDKFWTDYVKNADSSAKQVERIMKKTTDSMSQGLADFVRTGKLDFASLIRSILAEATKAQADQAMTKLFSLFKGGGGSGAAQFASVLSGGSGGYGFEGMDALMMLAAGFADGGVMTSSGPMALRKYARGGVSHGPEMSIHGEGARPEAYVPLNDGRTIPVTVNSKSDARPAVSLSYAPILHIDSRTDQAQVAQLVQTAVSRGNQEMLQHLRDTGALA